MSNSKYRYYTLYATAVVRANSQRDAIELFNGENVDGEILAYDVDALRISAPEARQMVEF